MTVVASRYEPKKNNLYETESWVTKAVLDVMYSQFDDMGYDTFWEPSAGNHKIADVLKGAGLGVLTSDIETYNREHDFLFDFLKSDTETARATVQNYGIDHIFTNPPYGPSNNWATRYARNALAWCDGWIFLVLTAKFDFGSSRVDLFRDNHRFWGKIALIDRISWEDNGKTGTEDHAVYVWKPCSQADHADPKIVYAGNRKKPGR